MSDTKMLATGDRYTVIVDAPVSGEPRIREATVFARDDETSLAEIRAPGRPDDPYTVTIGPDGKARC